MPVIKSREIRLISRPRGLPTADNFAVAEVDIAPPGDREVLVKNLFMSVDPYMRGRMREGRSYVAPFELNAALEGGAVGEVVESRVSQLKPGDTVVSNYGWREYFVARPNELHQVIADVQPLSVYLGVLGMTGMTAWIGLRLIELKDGETIYISGAAGAVGNVAGQLARLRGCRVIGSAGTPEKVSFLLDECGFDAAFNYKSAPVRQQLKEAAPEGIDVYFDNVGGETLDAALEALRVHGRILACGSISIYNDDRRPAGPSNIFFVTTKRLTMKGMIVRDWMDQLPLFEEEVGGLVRAGKLKTWETVVQGIDSAVNAFIGLFDGRNIGKMVVKLT